MNNEDQTEALAAQVERLQSCVVRLVNSHIRSHAGFVPLSNDQIERYYRLQPGDLSEVVLSSGLGSDGENEGEAPAGTGESGRAPYFG